LPIPPTKECGLLPPGIHEASMADVRERFAKDRNSHRGFLYDGLVKFINALVGLGHIEVVESILIDGSFVTDKHSPGDIDVVLEIKPDASVEKLTSLLHSLDRDSTKQKYGLEAFPYIPGMPRDIRSFFQYIREQEAVSRGIEWLQKEPQKGIVRVIYE